MSDDWNHRSQFAGPSDPGLKTVTANTNERRAGPTMSRQEVESFLAGDLTNQERLEAARERRAKRRHGDEKNPDEIDTRSNREKLLDGETVTVNVR